MQTQTLTKNKKQMSDNQGLLFLAVGGLFLYAYTQVRPQQKLNQSTSDIIRSDTLIERQVVDMNACGLRKDGNKCLTYSKVWDADTSLMPSEV